MFNRSGHSSTQVRKNYSEFQQKGQRFNEFNDHFEWLKSESHSVVSDSLWPHGIYTTWNSPAQNPGVGSLSLSPGDLPNPGIYPGLLHCRQILYWLSTREAGILKWVAYPFSSRPSWPRNQTRVSCFAGRFFTNWAIKVALLKTYMWKTEQLRKN